MALDWANQTTRLLKYQLLPHLFFGIIPAMAIAMKIHWHTNHLQELADDIRGMFALSRSYYLAALLVKLCADNYGVDLASIGMWGFCRACLPALQCESACPTVGENVLRRLL